MNQKITMNKVQILYLIIAALLGFGIPFLFIGAQVPSAMHAAILSNAAEYVILDEEDKNFWSVIPGRTGMEDIKSYYLFNCTNPEAVALLGEEPNLVEVGPFDYKYTHEFKNLAYDSEGSSKAFRVSFNKEFKHSYLGRSEDLKKEYRVINLSGMKRWLNAKSKSRFQIAIEGFFETFHYSRVNFVRDLTIRDLINFYANTDNIRNLTKGLPDVSTKVANGLGSDEYYGLMQDNNLYEWTLMCDNPYPYIEHEIMTYFNFSMSNFEHVKKVFCDNYRNTRNKTFTSICKKIGTEPCTDYSISFNQWMYANVTPQYSNITFKQLHGIYEFYNYTKKFQSMLKSDYKKQFENIDWTGKSYQHLLDTHHEPPDFVTDPASLLLFDNMKKLYDAGRSIQNPFNTSDREITLEETTVDKELDLRRLDAIADILKINSKQAFMLYCYFEYYINNTVLLQNMGGNLDRERIANYGAAVLKDITEYCRDFIDLLIYSYTLHRQNTTWDCRTKVEKYFTMPETISIMPSLSNAICTNNKFNTDISTPVGWKYFLESASYPYAHFYSTLNAYLASSVNGFNNATFNAMIFGVNSSFYRNLTRIKSDVRKHYNDKTGNKACENSYSSFCTKRQFFMTQFYQASITLFPFPASGLPAGDSISVWWRLIEPYIENVKDNYNGVPFLQPLPDLPIEVPVEIPYVNKFYGNEGFTKKDLYECLSFIKLYDTDVIYNVFLHTGSIKPKICPKFASSFFYKATRYWIRNVQFGPVFKRLYPEQVYFGYYDNFIRIEHDYLDYLEGDDCSVNPSIGYNPITDKNPKDETFKYFTLRHNMYTGSRDNSEVRRYFNYYGLDSIYYQVPVLDNTGDKCSFKSVNPFTTKAAMKSFTDGYQFQQYGGKSDKGHEFTLLESNTFRPLIIKRKTNEEHISRNLELNPYLMQLKTDYGCNGGVYMDNAIDMTSFFQYPSIISTPQFKDVNEPGAIIPKKIEYKRPLDDEIRPSGFDKGESFFSVEPYTGITINFKKKLMTSLVIIFDDLYERPREEGIKILLPFYSLYEEGSVSYGFIDDILSNINSSRETRKVISIIFVMFGSMFVIAGIGLIIRSCFFKPEEITDIETNVIPETKTVDNPIEMFKANSAPLMNEGEDLQKETHDTELKQISSIIDPSNTKDDDMNENLLP